MSQYWILAAILLPIAGGILTPILPFKKRRGMMIYLELLMIATSAIALSLVAHGPMERFAVIHFIRDISISFKIDGMSMLFAGLVSLLWPFAMLYSFEYMEHEEREKPFFMFYSMTFGITLGIAFAADMLTMYLFYELLTLVTIPLILHSLSREAVLATRKYIYYSLGGASLGLVGLIFLYVNSTKFEFVLGGILDPAKINGHMNLVCVIYLFAFLGFGVKAAIWPTSTWLPDAGVAPTPVTALLHAVAVVKAGVFAAIRLTYYSFGADVLRGTWVQYVVMAFALFTILYGSTKAVTQMHLKRRLAYSTVSNLSYVLFGVTIMTPFGMVGAMCHIVCHAYMKICAFLCAGAIMHQTERKHVQEIDGFAKKMPIVFGCFAVSAFSLMGVPGFAGFTSKWYLCEAAVASGSIASYIGIFVLLISAVLTAIYMLTIIVRAYVPVRGFNYDMIDDVKDPTWKMCLPLIYFSLGAVCLGLFSPRLIEFLWNVAEGIY